MKKICYLFVTVNFYIDLITKVERGANLTIREFLFKFTVLIILEFVSMYIAYYLNVKISNYMLIDIESDIMYEVKRLPYEKISSINGQYLAQRINNDSVTISDCVVEKFPYAVIEMLKITALIPILFSINTLLGFLSLLIVSMYIMFYKLSQARYYSLNKNMLEKQAQFFSRIGRQLFNILVIKINSWYEEIDSEFLKASIPFVKSSIKFLRYDFWLSNLSNLMTHLFFAVVIIVLGISLGKGTTSIGNLTTAIIYVQILIPGVASIIESGKSYQKYKVAKDRINELISMEKEHNGDKVINEINVIECVNLTVLIGEKEIFNNVSCRFEKGNIYLIVGENGAGKSTFVHTLLGIYRPKEGNILYNGIPIEELNMYSVRKKLISFTEQHPYLLEDTIYNNLVYGKEDTNKEEIMNKIRKINLLDFIEYFDKKYDTEINEKSSNISGGERQRIAISRSLLKEADVVIFDEPTNALDREGIATFMKILTELKRNKIVIVISHDPSLASIADKIIKFPINQGTF
ncbi:ABC transporter ATP-binding protein [Thermoanaerobacter sp. YS13]|uniref:ABC transporter ATP-binding protein n=1 Tax=Thermoanaerobacter sp. YS13 TaxID=1511746 RepID=UPI00137301D1|nr:ABC transporter ATP-binding protein [Thermoanaerobacter sp. YS13]